MLENQIKGLLQYCKVSGFRPRSLQALSIRLNDFNKFLKTKRISRVRSASYFRFAPSRSGGRMLE